MNFTVPPFDITEGNTSRMECVARLNPPTREGSFSWMLKDQSLSNGERVNIKSEYDPLGKLHTSRLLLKDLTWKDSGKVVSIILLILLLFCQGKWYFNINHIIYA